MSHAGSTGDGDTWVLFAARSSVALHRLLDVLPVFAGDGRIVRRFTLVPGSEFEADALAAIEHAGARVLPWEEACRRSFALVLTASPKGELTQLRSARVLLPHGAGFNKTVAGEGSPRCASGLDPAYLLSGGEALASLHLLSHPGELERLAARSPLAASRAAVVGDPTLERMLASADRREHYRAALGTGARTLIALTSTWGPESLLHRRPGLAARLAARLPYDAYQLALIVHPNERSRLGDFDLAERLAPALGSGVVLAGSYEEWAAVLVAADAVITDHGSAALYAAALGRALISAYDGGEELLPGTPMARLLAHSPQLADSGEVRADLAAALADALAAAREDAAHGGRHGCAHDRARSCVHDRAHGCVRTHSPRALADAAFAEQGRGLEPLRGKLYGLLGLDPPPVPVEPRPLPPPSGQPAAVPAAFAVCAEVAGGEVRVERFPAHAGCPPPHVHHLAAEHGAAGERHAQSAGLLYRRAAPQAAAGGGAPCASAGHSVVWTAGAWTAYALETHPGCRTAAVALSPELCVLRTRRTRAPLAVRIAPYSTADGRLVRTDPAAVLSAVHAWLTEHAHERHSSQRPGGQGELGEPGGPGPAAEPAEPAEPGESEQSGEPAESGERADLRCVVADGAFRVRLRPAGEQEAAQLC